MITAFRISALRCDFFAPSLTQMSKVHPLALNYCLAMSMESMDHGVMETHFAGMVTSAHRQILERTLSPSMQW